MQVIFTAIILICDALLTLVDYTASETLEDQIVLRSALEKAMNNWPYLDDPTYKSLNQVFS